VLAAFHSLLNYLKAQLRGMGYKRLKITESLAIMLRYSSGLEILALQCQLPLIAPSEPGRPDQWPLVW